MYFMAVVQRIPMTWKLPPIKQDKGQLKAALYRTKILQ
jgi:hypothetical protein